MSNIRISQLNALTNPIEPTDFIALVESSSLTTYRTSIQSIGNWLSLSGSASSSLVSISASWAPTPTLSESSSWASASLTSVSSSWASASLSSSVSVSSSYASRSFFATTASNATNAVSALTASKTNFAYFDRTIPFWDSTLPVNSNLSYGTGLFAYTNSVIYCAKYAGFSAANWSSSLGSAGFLTDGRVVANEFIGQDLRTWTLRPGDSIPSGSWDSGYSHTLNADMSSSLNGKWLRIAAVNSCSYAGGYPGIFGYYTGNILMRFVTSNDPGSSNIADYINMQVQATLYSAPSVTISATGLYENGHLIDKIRVGITYQTQSLPLQGPYAFIDVMFRELTNNESFLYFQGLSYGGVRFNYLPTLEPPDPYTGSRSAEKINSTYIVANAHGAGYYTTRQDRTDADTQHYYIIQGPKVGIGPVDYFSSSFDRIPQANLDVSGSINASSYYVSTGSVPMRGLSTIIRAKNLAGTDTLFTFTNGILTGTSP